ncbi:MAG: phospholipid carrier-dependent glycosyltransferase, partial [Rhodospirillales bacterium]
MNHCPQGLCDRRLWAAGWLALLAAALLTRPLLPVDETRYLSVAWEMWTSGDFLVPRLNGEPYSHKPPLLFWLIHAGWAVFGVSEWWARTVSPLFALGNLVLAGALARKLWPQDLDAPILAPVMLVGGILWAAHSTLTMFDMMVSFFTLGALLGVLEAYRKGGFSGWLLAGLSIGLGLLAKGPVILLHVLPVAFLVPLWAGQDEGEDSGEGPISWVKWYSGLIGAVAIGAGVGLAWALPAAAAGGEAYADAILWSQTAGRVS